MRITDLTSGIPAPTRNAKKYELVLKQTVRATVDQCFTVVAEAGEKVTTVGLARVINHYHKGSSKKFLCARQPEGVTRIWRIK